MRTSCEMSKIRRNKIKDVKKLYLNPKHKLKKFQSKRLLYRILQTDEYFGTSKVVAKVVNKVCDPGVFFRFLRFEQNYKVDVRFHHG